MFWWHSIPATSEETLIQQYNVISQKTCISFFLCIVFIKVFRFIVSYTDVLNCALFFLPSSKALLWQDFDATLLITGCYLFLSQSLPQKIMICDFDVMLQQVYRKTSLVNHCLLVVKVFVPFICVLCTLFFSVFKLTRQRGMIRWWNIHIFLFTRQKLGWYLKLGHDWFLLHTF